MKFYCPGRHQAATQIGTYFALLETMKGYQNEGIEPPGGAQCSRRVALQVLGMFSAWGQNVGQVEKAERVFWGIQEFSSCCFVQVTRVTASTKSALFCCCVIVDAKLLTNIKQQPRVGHTIFGGQ
ncbi:MAG: hypothetical protein ACLR54_02060 [Oscillospiraceae bacterium]|jgi:hypothetical protein